MKKKKIVYDIETSDFSGFSFPMVKNVQPTLLADVIQPMTAEQVREEMSKMFAKLEEQTGRKVVVVKTGLPIDVLLPDTDKK